MIASQSIGTLASVYPEAPNTIQKPSIHHPLTPSYSSTKPSDDGSYQVPPPYLAGHAFALPEYYAPCFPNNGSLLLIMFRISQNARNILASPNSLFDAGVLGVPGSGSGEQVPMPKDDDASYGNSRKIEWNSSGRATFVVQELPLAPSPVSRPRVSLMGNVTLLSDDWFTSSSSTGPLGPEDRDEKYGYDALESCYLAHHPDSKWWIPGKGAFHVRSLVLFFLVSGESPVFTFSRSSVVGCGLGSVRS